MMRPKDLRQGSGTKTFLDAMHEGKVHLARFVLDALDGRIINSKTENSRTPLMFAVCLQDPVARSKFTRLLLDKGADVNCQDEHGRSALSLACELGYLDAVKLLVQFNADPDVSDLWGNSALMYSAYAGHSQVLEFLVKAFKRMGLKLDRINHAGHSAAQVAHFFGHDQCVQALNFPGRKPAGSTEEPPPLGEVWGEVGAEVGAGVERRQPNRLPSQVLERFSKRFQSKTEEQLPGLLQRQLRVGDSSSSSSNGLWTRFRCQSPERKCPNQALPRCLEVSQTGQTPEEDQEVLFTAKQTQNCKLRDLRGVKTINHHHHPETSQKDVSRARGGLKQEQETPEGIPFWGKAKSFNLELLSSRKQSYQGDMRDMSLSARKLKRASLQEERSLIAKIGCQENTCAVTNDAADQTVTAPKAPLNGKSQSLSLKAPPEGEDTQTAQCAAQQKEEEKNYTAAATASAAQSSRRESQKRGSLPPVGRHNKLLLHRGEMEPEKIPVRPPGYTGLGTRLMRRFTAPEFMRMVMDCSSGGSSSHGRGRMSRSETFPFSHTHQKVNSQPSVDSISGVKCEFENSSHVTLD